MLLAERILYRFGYVCIGYNSNPRFPELTLRSSGTTLIRISRAQLLKQMPMPERCSNLRSQRYGRLAGSLRFKIAMQFLMKYFLWALVIVVLCAVLFLLALRTIPIHVYDGFESPHLSHYRWTDRRFEPGAVVSEESVVRSGRRALAITVRSGDRPEAASQSGAATERDELMESWWLFSRTGRTYVYSFSLHLEQFSTKPRTVGDRSVETALRRFTFVFQITPSSPCATKWEGFRSRGTTNLGRPCFIRAVKMFVASGLTFALLRDGTQPVKERSMQPCKDVELSIIRDPRSTSLGSDTQGTPSSISRPDCIETLCTSLHGQCTSMNIERISALRVVADEGSDVSVHRGCSQTAEHPSIGHFRFWLS